MAKVRDLPSQYKAPVFGDDRGSFFPLQLDWKYSDAENREYSNMWIQSNVSISKRGVLRGLHHQKGNYAQSKLLTVVKGQIIDFVVDLDKRSFGRTFFFHLGEGQTANQIYVPAGYLHGFVVVSDDAVIQYLVDNAYTPSAELSVKWDSVPAVKDIVERHFKPEEILLSDKDAIGVPLDMSLAE